MTILKSDTECRQWTRIFEIQRVNMMGGMRKSRTIPANPFIIPKRKFAQRVCGTCPKSHSKSEEVGTRRQPQMLNSLRTEPGSYMSSRHPTPQHTRTCLSPSLTHGGRSSRGKDISCPVSSLDVAEPSPSSAKVFTSLSLFPHQ